ncbi:MAG: YCF48-related protein [Ignavibacteriae bacterium]|nr:YCF48-related protein [Ignavibacteriota bacterium]
MRRLWLLILLLFISNIIYSQWIFQNSGTSRHLYGMDVVNENVVYCAAQSGQNVKTTDGGVNWFRISPPVIDDYGYCSFINPDTGVFVGPPGQLIRTTDGGISWDVIYHQLSGLRRVHFINSNLLYACGVGGGIIRSTNGGLNWFLIYQNFTYLTADMHFFDPSNGIGICANGMITKTSNGGINWIPSYVMLPVQFGDSSLYDLTFINQNTGFACGNNGIFIKTTNAGVNWTYYSNGNLNTLQGVYFVNENTGYTVGSAGRINKTTNGGINWTLQNSGTNTPLLDVEFINENIGWICGFNGTILKTTNGGSTWIQPINSEIPKGYKLEQNFPNPFNPSTNIKFSLPKTGYVKFSVYDMLGKEISVLINEKMGAGNYEVSFDGSNCPSGTYFYKLSTEDYSTVKRMVILK